jgi:large subunit ribosomal protein L25
MTSNLVLDSTIRSKSKGASADEADSIPCVLYGNKIENVILWVKRKEFRSVYEQAGESTIIKLKLDGKDERNVIIKEVQKDILNSNPIHIDFYQVRMDEEIEAEIELEFIGESPAVKELGGVLVKNMDEVPVKCLPGDLPPSIEVDVSRLKTFEDYIYIKDLTISDKVEVLVDLETVVAMVSPPRSEEELAELESEVKEDVTKVEGVVKEEETAAEEGEPKEAEKKPVADGEGVKAEKE